MSMVNTPLLIYGNGEDIRDYLYVSDAVDALLLAISKQDDRGIFNISGGQATKIKNVAKLIIRLSNSTSKIKFLKRKKKYYKIIYGILKARKKLNFNPKIKLEQGLLNEIEWFRLNYKK